jgi:hypothetical protein
VDASSYALVQGVRSTRAALSRWNCQPWSVLRGWLAGSAVAALTLLTVVWLIATVTSGLGPAAVHRPPLIVGDGADVGRIFLRNLLVLALHAMACVAGFIAGSSLPLQAQERTGLMRTIHERGGRLAMIFVFSATTFSLSAQAYVLGISVERVAHALHTSPALLLLGLLPHALPELIALFLPLAAWILASRRGQWDELLAATIVTVSISLPVLALTALWEVYVAPHVLAHLIGY